MTRVCLGCGADLTGAHGKRKWCSERCRKRQYAGTCEVCGGPTDGTCPGRGVSTFCQACRNWDREAIVNAILRWAEEHDGIAPRATDFRGSTGDGYPCDWTVIHHFFGRWNLALREAGFGVHQDKSPERQAWIEEQLRAGVPTREIAARLGVTPAAIHERMRTRGTTVTALRREAVTA